MQRTTLAVAVVLVAFAGIGGLAAADGSAAQSDVVTIELSVSTPDGEPVGNAQAVIEWDGGSTTATTTSNGRTFADVPPDADIEITLTHDQYVKNEPHEVQGVSSNQVVETTMHPAATGEIEVVDADGPVEGATVRLRKQGQSAVAARGSTNADGVFTSGEVETGTYHVSVKQPGYYDASQTVDLEGASNATVQLEEGDVTIDLFVQDATEGGPGPLSADVNITRDGQRVVSATTNDQGRRSVVLDVNRNFDVVVSRQGYLQHSTSLRTGESDEQATFNITRTPSISLAAGNERVVVGETLRVEVTDEYDRPVEGATVLVGGEEAGQTDADGVAHVEISTEGEVDVVAEYDGRSTDPAPVTGVPPSEDGDGDSSDGADDGDGDASDGTDDAESDGGEDEDDGDDGGTGDGSPGFGVVAALVGTLAGIAALARRR